MHARAHVALIRFLDVVDDTKQTGSLISGELGPACAELALDACGAQVLLSLLVDASSKYLSAAVKGVLRELRTFVFAGASSPCIFGRRRAR